MTPTTDSVSFSLPREDLNALRDLAAGESSPGKPVTLGDILRDAVRAHLVVNARRLKKIAEQGDLAERLRVAAVHGGEDA